MPSTRVKRLILACAVVALGPACSRADTERDSGYAPRQMEPSPTFLSQRRAGPRPETTTRNPHTQLSQNAPRELQERVFDYARALEGVVVGPSLVSVPGARAFHLPEQSPPAQGCFMVEREFAHLHPHGDGSLHMTLPPAVVDGVIANGWAERHPLAGKHGLPDNIVMVYGPRDEQELLLVQALIRASHGQACGKA